MEMNRYATRDSDSRLEQKALQIIPISMSGNTTNI